jgi:dimethylaniline monooxygenase (N-oxide forming)
MSEAKPDNKIAVIGAGACGLCAAKYLTEAGFNVTIFEIGTQIGGLWCFMNDNGRSSAYRTLHINTSRSVTRFQDLDFDTGVQAFPDHEDMHRYLTKYAEHFGLVENIRFQTRVVDIRPAFYPAKREQPIWKVVLENGTEELFDSVVVASGHLTRPLHVPMFQNDFGGQYMHGHDYKAPDPFVGKRICVVGVGNSACDMATDVCSTAEDCVLVARSGVLILPKLFCGIPFTDITRKIQQPWVPIWLRRKLTGWLSYLVQGSMTKLGFKPLDQRAHVTSNGTIVTDIVYNRIKVKQGIERIDGKTIHFVDGSSGEFDVLLAATGYLIDLPFISRDIVPLEDNRLELFKRVVQPKWPGLYLMGFFNTDTALNMVYEHQARWVRDIELGKAKLPSIAAMEADIAAKREWVETHYKASPRHTIEEEHIPYIGELKKSIRQMRRL